MENELIDYYDAAIAHFNKFPEEIEAAWQFPGEHQFGYLFSNAGKARYLYKKLDDKHWLNDPISIKNNERFVAQEERITIQIRGDESLPSSIRECNLQHLPRIAEWQRRLDEIFNRPDPVKQPEIIEEIKEDVAEAGAEDDEDGVEIEMTCKFCGNRCENDAHLHQEEYVCEHCWDERLRSSE